jgi:hypothetical protein
MIGQSAAWMIFFASSCTESMLGAARFFVMSSATTISTCRLVAVIELIGILERLIEMLGEFLLLALHLVEVGYAVNEALVEMTQRVFQR